jgi:ribonuclease P protein component
VRIGVVVPLHGHTAVERNLVKRRLRELVRHRLLGLPQGVDIVLKASEHSYTKTFEELQSEVESMRALLEQRVMTP